jgi:hypothetical protein
MSHTITCKLNKATRQHQNASGMTFFVDLGEKNYNYQTKINEWTNYSAALFAKDGQIQFYTEALVEGAIIEVSGTGIIIEMPDDPQYKPRLQIQDAKLGFVHSGQPAQQGGYQQQPAQQTSRAPQQQYQQQQPPQSVAQHQQQAAQQGGPVHQQQNNGVYDPNQPPQYQEAPR